MNYEYYTKKAGNCDKAALKKRGVVIEITLLGRLFQTEREDTKNDA